MTIVPTVRVTAARTTVVDRDDPGPPPSSRGLLCDLAAFDDDGARVGVADALDPQLEVGVSDLERIASIASASSREPSMRACPVFCVSVLQVGVDSVGVGGGELGQGRALSRVVGHGGWFTRRLPA